MDKRVVLRHFRAAAASLIVLVTTNLASADTTGEKNLPDISLPGIRAGEEAITALGEHLPAVAAAHRMDEQELRRILREDRDSKVDPKGRVFYTDPDADTMLAGSGTTQTSDSTVEPLLPLEQTFLLHSRLGASKIIYLDFDGHTLSGTAWNSYNGGADIICPPWDIDGNPGVFGTSERTAIQQVWKRVAEDYAPFEVDVTTEYPGEGALTRSGSTDLAYGNRILISPISKYFGAYGGISYLSTFDDIGDYYKPSLVFPENLANGQKYIGEAASHECGHALGLSHDGTTTGSQYYQGQGSGETGWAPIMGNAYYQNLTQWSKGEYAYANNKQDDLAIIASYVGYRPDDHGNTDATATVLPSGTTVNVSGIIDRTTEEDVFKFTTGAGTVSLNIAPTDLGPDCDFVASLYNSAGGLVASSNPADTLGASLSVGLNAGSYFLHVKGTGKGDPLATGYSSYASLGQYTVTGALVATTGNVAPTAVAKATPTSGYAPLTVQFDGSASSDPDGSILSYFWDFGDGTSAQQAVVAHAYGSAGTYTARLTVMDNSGSAASSTVQISVLALNKAPVVVASANPTSGTAPLSVSFSGYGSYDSDGTITAYQWSFGDGATDSGSSVQHTYQSGGSYTATLTVTDNAGATSSSSVVISVQSSTTKTVYVSSIQMRTSPAPAGARATATVSVRDNLGLAVSGASVYGTWSGSVSGTATALTDSLGNAVFTSSRFKRGGTARFTVNNITKAGYVYDPTHNVVTTASISAAELP